MIGSAVRRFLALVGLFLAPAISVSAPALAVDLAATRAFLRTGAGTGDEVPSPQPGQDVFVHVAYDLSAADGPVTVTVAATIDGMSFCRGDLRLGGGGSSTVWCNGAWTVPGGTHTLRWELDAENVLAESNETNNIVEATFTVGIDIELRRAFLRSGATEGKEVLAPALGEEVFLNAAYFFSGGDDELTVAILATIDGELECGGDLSLPSGGLRNLHCNRAWTATAGTHTLRWELDADNLIDETNEVNNVAEYEFTTGAVGDVQALRAYLRTGPNSGSELLNPAVGQEVYLHVDARVAGVEQSIPVRVRALLDGAQHCSGTNNIGAASEPVWCSAVWTATRGSHTLRWELDADDGIAEADEGNNASEATFTTGANGGCPGDCNGNGVVIIAELIRAVRVALDLQDLEDCAILDTNDDGRVSIGELIAAVNRALNGCT